jgi:UDP-N-acetylmuramyl pentapeptide phosphotransferase/UDP-N-acetylglucosamine-1-phosphate transferase
VFYDLDLFSEVLWLLPVVFVLLIGWINAFNFMDGINGITVLYALTAIVSFAYLPLHEATVPLLVTMGLSCLVFGAFNLRKKAKTFAGDVGSISMALFLGYFIIKTIMGTEQFGYILFFAVYGIDAVITIGSRLVKKENIFQPHRSHLYQYLANEMGISHVVVAFIYAVIQLGINIMVIVADQKGVLSLAYSIGILILMTLVYTAVRVYVLRKIALQQS